MRDYTQAVQLLQQLGLAPSDTVERLEMARLIVAIYDKTTLHLQKHILLMVLAGELRKEPNVVTVMRVPADEKGN